MRLDLINDISHELACIKAGEVIVRHPCFHAPEVEERLDKALKAGGLARDDAVILTPPLFGREPICFQHLGHVPNGGERRAKLVRHRGHKIGLKACDLAFASYRAGDEVRRAPHEHQHGRHHREQNRSVAGGISGRLHNRAPCVHGPGIFRIAQNARRRQPWWRCVSYDRLTASVREPPGKSLWRRSPEKRDRKCRQQSGSIAAGPPQNQHASTIRLQYPVAPRWQADVPIR